LEAIGVKWFKSNPEPAPDASGGAEGPENRTDSDSPIGGRQRAERDNVIQELKEAALKVKALVTAKDSRAPEAAKLATEAGGFLSWETLAKAKEKLKALKDLIGGHAGVPEESPRREPKSNAEVSLDEFNSDLGKAIDNVEKMKKAADKLGADELSEHIGKVGKGLEAVKEKSDKLVEVVELGRDLQEFKRAVEAVQGLDLNRDYKQAAVAMGDLANIGGKLAKKATGNGVPGLDAYFTLVQNAGAVWEMGARLRERKEKELDDIAKSDPTSGSGGAEEPSNTKVVKTNTGPVTPDGLEQFMLDARNTFLEEAKHLGGVYSNEAPGWDLTTDAFLKAWAEVLPLHKQRDAILVGPLSADYRQSGKKMQAPYAEAKERLESLQDLVGKRDDISVTYEPALKALKKIEP
jgi:hypothetical protein